MTPTTQSRHTLRRALVGLVGLGVVLVPAACGSDDDTDVTTPDISVPDSILAPGDSTDLGTDSSNTVSSTMTSDPMTGDTVMSGSDGTASNDDSTTP